MLLSTKIVNFLLTLAWLNGCTLTQQPQPRLVVWYVRWFSLMNDEVALTNLIFNFR